MYQLTTAASIEDFLNKLAVAAASTGWTVHRNTLAGSNRLVTLQRSGDYIHLWNSDQTGIKMRGSVGYSSGAGGDAQPLQAVYQAFCNTGAGPFANAVFFADNSPAEHFFAALEVEGGKFRHLSFGMLVKTGAYAGGTFYDCTNWLADGNSLGAHDALSAYNHRMFDVGSIVAPNNSVGSVRCDVDGNTNYWAPFFAKQAAAGPAASGGLGPRSLDASYNDGDGYRAAEGFYFRSINSWSGQTPLQRIQVRVERPDGYWSVIGEVPGVRYLNMARFAPGEEFTIATDTYKVFPFIRQGDTPGGSVWHQYSQNHAYGYLKKV